MTTYEPELVIEAWKEAVSTGVVDHSKLRPEVARAWERCIGYGVDPWSSSFPFKDEEMLAVMRKKYAAVIEAARPVMLYLMAMFNSNVSIADMNAFIFDLVTPLGSYPRTLGTYSTERNCGNGNITTAINEGKAVRVDRFEHFRTSAQNYSGIAAIVKNINGDDFVLCMNNPFAVFPENALNICVRATELIKKLSAGRREAFMHLSTALFFDPIIESDEFAVIVLNDDGNVLTANGMAKPYLPGYEKQTYASVAIDKYVKKKSGFDVINTANNEDKPQTVEFKSVKRGQPTVMTVVRFKKIKLINGQNHNLLVLKPCDAATEATEIEYAATTVQPDNFVGQSKAWQRIDALVRDVAPYNANVMITGETGTGKEVVAQALHKLSGRKGEFVAINCGGLPRELLSSELFGYESGAFTGARATGAMGKFEYANGGTLFLDEIGDMPVDMQASLLRAIQEQCITRIGANRSIPVDVRIIAATNQNVEKLIEAGRFRGDLWYRLSVIEIQMPPLKERKGDVALLADHFNETLCRKFGVPKYPLSDDVIRLLDSYSYPGNVRELKNIMEKAIIMAQSSPLTVDNFPENMRIAQAALGVEAPREELKPAASFKEIRESREREKIVKVLEEEHGNISHSAKRLNMSRNTLYRKIDKMNIKLKTHAD